MDTDRSHRNKQRPHLGSWLGWIVAAAALLTAGIMALWVYVLATAVPLHPSLDKIPSVTRTPPATKWKEAVRQARQIALETLKKQNLPGLSVAVGIDGEIVWSEGFGWANLEGKIPVTPETRFRIGTASTALTSAAVGVLLEQNRLKLDEPIQTYVPEFPVKPWPVTLRQLMAHQAGLRTDGGDEGPLLAQPCPRPVDALPYFANQPLLLEPGTQFRHSAYGWILVSAAIESASDRSFPAFMREEVFQPLGMRHTGDDSLSDESNPQATSYFPRFAADPGYGPQLMRPIELSGYAGAAAFVSTPSDLVRFAIAMQNGSLLKPETVALLQTPGHIASGDTTGYGLGWSLQPVQIGDETETTVGHDGDLLGGQVASLLVFPRRRLTVAVISNTSFAETNITARKIALIFARGLNRSAQ